MHGDAERYRAMQDIAGFKGVTECACYQVIMVSGDHGYRTMITGL